MESFNTYVMSRRITNMLTLFGMIFLVLSSQIHVSAAETTSSAVSEAVTHFSLDLLKATILDNKENVVMSPVSVYTLLAMVQQGAKMKSLKEMDNVLYASSNTTRDGCHNLTLSIQKADSLPSLRFLNKARVQGSHNFVPDFKKTLVKVFRSRFYVPKQDRGQQSSRSDNRTLPMGLTKIVVPHRNTPKTFFALANLLHFNGYWAQMDSAPVKIKFSRAPGEEIQIDGIQLKKKCFTGESPDIGAKWIHLPLAIHCASEKKGIKPKTYWSKRGASLMIILPTTKHGLDNLVERLTPQHVNRFINYRRQDKKMLDITLPEFEISNATNLIPYLRKLGLRDVFQKSANLSGISTSDQLYISKSFQTSRIILDSFGARTSELTEINSPTAFDEWDQPEQTTVVDEPFLFFIVDGLNHLPLLVGRVERPVTPVPVYERNLSR
ncbi:leukocyte elastase inhibitor-like [Periplaneta americana]|uniref:leukocyte elastase inhibitor-like n=1 Tax=Periplaneta americana TaxID=6978 RepID=UPI0037E71F0B